MQANDFWCRAFLAAMGGNYSLGEWDDHGESARDCEQAADAALEVAQRRGMVTGERTASALDNPSHRDVFLQTADDLERIMRECVEEQKR